MDPTLSIDGPTIGHQPADDDALAASAPDEPSDQDQTRGPGDGDARVMAWARAM